MAQMLEIPLEDFTFEQYRPLLKFPTLPDGRRVETAEDFKEWFRIRVGHSSSKQLLESIKKNGLIEPILIYLDKSSKKYVIVDGYHRYFIYEKLNEEHSDEGWNKIPTKIVFSQEPSLKEIQEFELNSQLSDKP